MNLLKPISISLSPNTEKDDVRLAFKLIFSAFASITFKLYRTYRSFPKMSVSRQFRWKEGPAIKQLENEFKNYLGVKYAVCFNSGRSALMAILNSLELKNGNEVLLQAFTCNAVPNPVLWQGLKPVFVDCDEKTFNIDIEDLKRKITSRSRALIVQHTFGLPAELDKISEICRQNNLILIEDCAHSLGAEYQGGKTGTFGKASLFSFGRDKVISSVYGGMAATNDEKLAEKMREYQLRIGYSSFFWIFQQLLHPLLMNWLILPTYGILGKYLLVLFQWSGLLSKAVHRKEKKGKKPGYFSKRLPNALAILALNQLQKLERFNRHRQKIANFYCRELKGLISFELPQSGEQICLRFTVKHPRAYDIIKKAWRKNLLIGDWYASPVAPKGTDLEKMGYDSGSCPKAEKLAKETLNLPTHINISLKEAEKIVNFLKNEN